MKRFLLLIILICTGTISRGQVAYPYQDIKLEKPSDYAATVSLALSASTFLLTTVFNGSDKNRANAWQFLSKWLSGSKEYNLYMKGIIQDMSDDPDLLCLYFAAVAKYSLEHKTESANPLTVEQHAYKMVLAYSDDPKNKFKLKKKYRKLIEKNTGS